MMSNCPNCGKPYKPGDEVCPNCGYVFPFTTDILATGTVLQGRYEIQQLSHTGGMGYIYLAKDKKLYDRLCIVKQVKEPVKSDSDLKKLEEEAMRMAKLSHPNVAMVLDHFVENGYYFLVGERISGKTLSEVFEERHGQLSEEEVISWAIAMCDVINYIHSEGIIHRDISPDNVMLTKEGSIKFVDFGTLREFRYITTKGTAGMGKYGYTPPEQWQGRPTPQSDIFALGATIYYLLTGSLPLSKEYLTGQGPQAKDWSPSFPPIRTKNTSISPELEAILQKALQLDASSRYSSATEFGQALRDLGKVEVSRQEIVEEAKPVLSVDRELLDFTNIIMTHATKSFTVRNIGTGKLTGSITTTQPWLKVSPTRIELETDEQTVRVTVDTRYLYYEMAHDISIDGVINIVTNGGNAKVTVSLSTTTAAKPAGEPVPTGRGSRKPALFAVVGCVLVIVIAIVIGLAISEEHVPAPPMASQSAQAILADLPKIAFIRYMEYDDTHPRIYVMNADGSHQIEVAYDAYAPAWSPDGTRIAFCSGCFVHPGFLCSYIDVANADGSNRGYISGDLLSFDHRPGQSCSLAWSPDSSKVAFTACGDDDHYNIYVTSFDDGFILPSTPWQPAYDNQEKQLTDHPETDFVLGWSPDGTKILFRSYRKYPAEIYVMDAYGSNITQLTNNDAEDWTAVWAPDSSRIAYVSEQDGNREIYTVNVDGSKRTRLTNNSARDDSPVWSPDGTKIAFVSDRDGNYEIYVTDVDRNAQRNLSRNRAHDRTPTWSPYSKYIVFSSNRDGNWEIYAMDTEGRNEIRLTHNDADDTEPAWSPMKTR